jgi:hypothetical protein
LGEFDDKPIEAIILAETDEVVKTTIKSSTFYQNYLAVSNTADVTGGKPIAV